MKLLQYEVGSTLRRVSLRYQRGVGYSDESHLTPSATISSTDVGGSKENARGHSTEADPCVQGQCSNIDNSKVPLLGKHERPLRRGRPNRTNATEKRVRPLERGKPNARKREDQASQRTQMEIDRFSVLFYSTALSAFFPSAALLQLTVLFPSDLLLSLVCF